MSYRSDIRIRLTKKDYEKLVKKFDEELEKKIGYNLFKDLDIYKEENDVIVNDEEFDTIYFGWNCVKWYDGYEDVDLIMDFIRNCDYYAFCRIGESCEGDIETEESGFDMIGYYYAFDDE